MLGLATLAFAGALVLQGMGCRSLIDPSRPEPALAYGLLMLPLNALAFSLLGALINTYRPENRFGWLASLYGVALMWALLVDGYGQCSLSGRVSLPGGDYAIWMARFGDMIAFLALAMMPWLFPDGHFLSARWRRAGLSGVSLVLALNALRALWPGLLRVDSFGRSWIENPASLDLPSTPWLDSVVRQGPDRLIMVLFLGGIVSLLLRWRRSSGETRQQMKWLTTLLATSGVLFLAVEVVGSGFYPAIFDGWFYLIELLFFWLGMPVAVGLAVFKYRLYDIDIVIRRTVLYAVLTAILALVYFGSVTLLTGLFSSFAGQQPALAIVVSTLVIAALFAPLRRRVQDTIDRRFFRRKYDAQQVLARFALAARDETDLDALTAELVRVVDDTMQPERVSVWLRFQSEVTDA